MGNTSTLCPIIRIASDKVPSARYAKRCAFTLILAVVLLALLGAMGIAFLVTARHDRYASRQHADNTQADLMLEGADQLTQAAISEGVAPPAAGVHVDGVRNNHFLASRVPVRLSDLAPQWTLSEPGAGADIARIYRAGDYVSDNDVTWVCRRTHAASAAYRPPNDAFWLAPGADGSTPAWLATSEVIPGLFTDPADSTRQTAVRGSVYFPTSITVGGKSLPALRFFDTRTGRMETFLAADTDGDGVADALLLRLPGGPLAGIEYFAAMRVVDANSAVNASVAWEPAAPDLPGQWFPTNVNLAGMLRDPAEIERLNSMRFGAQATASDASSVPAPSIDLMAARLDDAGNLREDFVFSSPYEALWMQLGRRLTSAGFASDGVRFAALPASDSGALAYGGGVIANAIGQPSLVESLLPSSTSVLSPGGAVAASKYSGDPQSIAAWFNTYDYARETADRSTWRSRRPLLTTRNPLSAIGPAFDMLALAKAQPQVVTTSGEAGKMPVAAGPAPRASINSASFGELWRAFFSVMVEVRADGSIRTPFSDYVDYCMARAPAGMYDDPYLGMRFTSDGVHFTPENLHHPARMFRSPIRAVANGAGMQQPFDPNTPRLPPDQVALLRAALAAVNAIDLRKHDDQITAQDIHLVATVGGSPQPVTARVYGNQRQPFIFEVYAENDSTTPSDNDAAAINPNGYVAVVLYNPYSAPIDLINCKLALISRATADGQPASPNLGVLDASRQSLAISFASARSNIPDFIQPPPPTLIPPHGFLVLENYDRTDPADRDDADRAAMYRPAGSGLAGGLSPGQFPRANFAFLPNLDQVFNREMVLVRPLGADYVWYSFNGIDYDGTDPARPLVIRYRDATGSDPEAVDMAPLDSFDFTGLQSPQDASTPTAWHYRRANRAIDQSRPEWAFVYPGRYDGNQPALAAGGRMPRQEGTEIGMPATLGVGSDHATFSQPHSIRLHDAGWPDPFPVVAPTGNRFPFGGFARDGDIPRIPFIGAYRIRLDSQAGTNRVIEINPITMDSAFAEDTRPVALPDPRLAPEQVGRFAPLLPDLMTEAAGIAQSGDPQMLTDPARAEAADQFAGDQILLTDGPGKGQIRLIAASDPAAGTLTVTRPWDTPPAAGSSYLIRRTDYAWAVRLLDAVGVLTPTPMTLPQANAADYRYWDTRTGTWTPVASPAPVAAGLSGGYGVVEGLININTAPWKVLAAVPFLSDAAENDRLASMIVQWRHAHGPFRSLFDLLQVPAFRRASRRLLLADPAATDLNDFESQYYLLARVANLLTTRSDSFTCYVTIQGWRGAGTANAEMVLQRHDSFILDRSSLAAPGRALRVARFYNGR